MTSAVHLMGVNLQDDSILNNNRCNNYETAQSGHPK